MTCAVTKSVETIADLHELKSFACPRVTHLKDWYMQCIDCKQQKYCDVGKQAVALISKETEPPAKPKPKRIHWSTEKARAEYEEALKQDDPIGYIAEKRGFDRAKSTMYMHNSKRRYPDIFERLSRDKRSQIDKAKDRYAEALKHDDPIGYLSEMNGWSRNASSGYLWRWKKKYPDVYEKYCGHREDDDKEELPMKMKTDEISVNDFLDMVDTGAEKETSEEPEVFNLPFVDDSLTHKMDQLVLEIKDLEKAIKEFQEELAQKKDALTVLKRARYIVYGNP